MPVGGVAKVEAYLARLPGDQRAALRELRKQILAAAPMAQEGFGYGLPGFYLDGPLFYYGAAKRHCSLYGNRPPGFEGALAGFETSKGTVKFTPEHPVPASLLKRMVKAKAAANRARAAPKRRKAQAVPRVQRRALRR